MPRVPASSFDEASAAFEALADAVLVFDRTRRLVRANAAATRLLGSRATTSGDFATRFGLAVARGTPCVLEEALAGVAVRCTPMELGQADDVVALSVDAFPMRGAREEIVGATVVLRDVSEERATEQTLRRVVTDFHSLLERMPDAIAVRQRERVVYVNAAFERLLARTRQELVGASLADLIHPDDRAHLTRTRTIVGSGALGPVEIRFRRGDDAWITLETDPAQVIDFDGEPARLLVARDVAERRAQQAHALLTERLASMGLLAAGVAHEINNPLAYVLMNLEQALAVVRSVTMLDATLGAELEARLRDAIDGSHRIRDVALDLKLFSRDDEAVAPVDVRRVLDSASRMAWNQVRHRARIERDYQEIPDVDGSEARLGQVFLNLMVNAAHAIPEGQADRHLIRLSTRFVDGKVQVRVSDNGSGIPDDVRERLFEPFQTTKTHFDGTGLGLFVCRRIVASLGGTIEVQSRLGEGTTFTVSFAPSTKPRARAAPPRLPSVAIARRRLLIVDDEPALVSALARLLRAEHDVDTHTSPAEALAALENGTRYDLIFCDVMMPQITGADFFERLSAFAPQQAQRIVFLTGGAFGAAARAFLARVPNPRIEKPFDGRALKARLREWLVDPTAPLVS